MKVIILCEFSGTVRDAFISRGHDAISCDLLPSEKPGPHIQRDCRTVGMRGFDLAICHPPCTYLCNSGVRWLTGNAERWSKMVDAAKFFRWMLELPVPMVAVENPVMHKHAVEIVGRRQDQLIQPWQFGHGETKATCLWLKGLPKLDASNVVSGREAKVHRMPPSENRWKERSRTYQGIADAMAEQWGNVLATA